MHIHSSRFIQHAPVTLSLVGVLNACAASLPDPQLLASDRMSRSEMAHRTRSYPTAPQVMITDSKDAISEAQNLNLLGVRCKRAGRAAWVANGVWHWHLLASPLHPTMVLLWCLWHHGSCPLRPLWMAAQLLEFAGPTFTGSMEDAPASIYGCNSMMMQQAVSERAETGQIGRSPIGPVGRTGFYRRW